MTRYFLTRIKIEGFRGINNESSPLELKFRTDSVNSVYAINGLGKSSVYEALNYAIRGDIPKLTDLQAQERPEEYYCNKFHSQGTATIEIELAPDDGSPNTIIIVQRDGSGNRTVSSPTGTPDPDILLNSLNEDFTLLDYQTFERFIDSSPLERGRSFSALLGLSIYSDFRQALQSVSDTRVINSQLDISSIQTEIRGAEEAANGALRRLGVSYEGITGKQLTDVSQLEQYVREVVEALGGIPLLKNEVDGKDLKDINFETLNILIKSAEGGDERKELEKLIETTTKAQGIGAGDIAQFNAEQIEMQRLLKEKEELISNTPGEPFKQLYDATKSLIESGEWKEANKCPLCQSEIKEAISDVVDERLEKYKNVTDKNNEISSVWEAASWVRRLNTLERASILEVPDDKKIFHNLSQEVSAGIITTARVTGATASLVELEKILASKITLMQERKEELEQQLPPSLVRLTEQVEHGRQFHQALSEYQEKTTIKDIAQTKLNRCERWKQFINRASAVFAAAESELSSKKIEAIDQEYKTIFERIMGVSDVVPELQRADRREDLHVQLSNFHGQSGLSARALLSESYRNALAISVFLSAAMRRAGTSKFIILDDITSSFDAGHQWKLMEIIREELQQPNNTDGLQFIILSHDSLLEKYFDKLGSTAAWHHQKLQGMPPVGMVLSQSQDSNRLRSNADRLLEAGQVQEAKPLIRQYLEHKLLKIIQKVKIPVQLDFAIKDDKKMVSNSIDAINVAIDLHDRAGDLVLDAQQTQNFKSVLVPALIGNWVSHYETNTSGDVAPAVLKGVLDTIDQIEECFKFDDNSSGSVEKKWYKSLSSRI